MYIITYRRVFIIIRYAFICKLNNFFMMEFSALFVQTFQGFLTTLQFAKFLIQFVHSPNIIDLQLRLDIFFATKIGSNIFPNSVFFKASFISKKYFIKFNMHFSLQYYCKKSDLFSFSKILFTFNLNETCRVIFILTNTVLWKS